MAHTFTATHTHIIFSTRQRAPLLIPDLRPRLFNYMGGIIRNLGGFPILLNGVEDHIHILAEVPPAKALSDLLRDLKGDSSRWAKETLSAESFAWQTGYAAFSVSKSNLQAVKTYIANQEQHHRRKTFQEEYLDFLHRHGIKYDQRFVFD
jgi:REP element-mobilizing transposase RayT